jgi:uncharacterized protein
MSSVTLFDSLVFLGRAFSGVELTVDTLLRQMDDLGIDRAAVCPAKPAEYHLPPENERVAAATAQHPDRLVFLCRVDPNRADAVHEVTRCFDELGARGLFLHPAEELFRAHDPCVDSVVTEAERRHRPVVIASGYPWVSEPLQVAALAARFPDLSFVMTNGGQFNISGLGMADAWIALEHCPNLHVQTAGEYRQDFIEDVASTIGGRILFASSAPCFDQRYELARARQAALSQDVQRLMLGVTAERLFGLKAE